MPNANVLSEKQAIVENLVDRLQNSCAGVLVNYTGITVADDTQLRRDLRNAGVEYTVVKNTLVRFAADRVGFNGLDSVLNGPTAIATSATDPIAAAKILCEYADKKDSTMEIKAGYMDGKLLSIDEIKALAAIPALPVLRAQVLGTMLAPITSLAIVLKAIAEKNGAPAEEAPAAE